MYNFKIFSTVKTGAIQLKRAIDLKSSIQNSINRFDSLGLPGIDIEKKQSQNSKPSIIAKQTKKNNNKSTESCSNELLDVAPVFDIDQMEFGASLITNIQADHKYYQRNDISGDTDNAVINKLIKKSNKRRIFSFIYFFTYSQDIVNNSKKSVYR